MSFLRTAPVLALTLALPSGTVDAQVGARRLASQVVTAAAAPTATASQVGAVAVTASLALPAAPLGLVELDLYNVNSHESARFVIRADGSAPPSVAADLSRFFRCKRTHRRRLIAPGELANFAKVAAHYPGHVLEVISGYRARPYGAPHSKHFEGHAIDFRVRGVPTKEVRTFAWSLEGSIGLGYYSEEDFLHLDYRPGEHRIAWEQKREGLPNHYDPAWAAAPQS